ncbi:hypothetical protein SDJN03_17438, partial [Cucurbita argyrosperma subsp. sororia]
MLPRTFSPTGWKTSGGVPVRMLALKGGGLRDFILRWVWIATVDVPISSFSISAGRVVPLLYQAVAYYYHGLILDKGSNRHAMSVLCAVCCFLAAEGLLPESKKASRHQVGCFHSSQVEQLLL